MSGKYYSDNVNIRTMMYRYAVINSLLGLRFDDIDVSLKLAKEDISNILNESYSEQKERILFLCASGVLNYQKIEQLIIHNNVDFLEDVMALENQLMADEEKSDDARIPYSVLEDALLICAAAKKYDFLSSADFKETVTELAKRPSEITIINGLIACNRELTEFMHDIGAKFVRLTPDMTVEVYSDLEHDEYFETVMSELSDFDITSVSDSDIADENSKIYDYPFIADSNMLLKYLKVYSKLFGKDFLRHITEDAANISEDIITEYEKYVDDKKLTFNIGGFVRRRKVCGDIVNHYDYDYNTVENNELKKQELIKAQDYSCPPIKLIRGTDVKNDCTAEELRIKALNKYKKDKILPDRFVAEIFCDNNAYYYVYCRETDKFESVDTAEFSKQLFDFNKIWSVVRKAAAERKIIVVGNNITFPYLDEVAPDEQKYAIEIAREQYERQKARQQKSSTQISTLRQLMSGAEKQAQEQAAEKKAKLAEAEAAKKNRAIKNNPAPQ